jgi:hypothetical protein
VASVGIVSFACSVYEVPGAHDTPGDMTSAAGTRDTHLPTGGDVNAGSAASGGGNGASPSSNGGVMPMGAPPNPLGGSSDGGEPAAGAPSGGGATTPDDCPDDPDKVVAGDCGCGVPEQSTSSLSDCHVLEAKLIHRFDFEGTGTVVKDRVGTADGVVKGTSLSIVNGEGVVLFGGGTGGGYVDLPNELLSTLTSATIEAWITWGGGSDWQRVFDFGDSTAASPENNPAAGKTYLYLTPRSDAGAAAAVFSTDGWTKELRVTGTVALPTTMAHVAVVADAAGDELRLFIDGKPSGKKAWTGTLASVNDVNVWLGRSQYDTDPELSAIFHEFRIYGSALTDADIAASFAAGPDPAFLAY